jgi:putative DNA primase/helicase
MFFTVPEMLQRGSEMSTQPVDWAWEGLVPMGKLTLITGDPGVGKSLVALHVAAMVTRGVRVSADFGWIGSDSIPAGEKGSVPLGVIVFPAANRPEDTVLPRLIALGADPSMVFFVKREYVKEVYDDETDDEKSVVRRFRLSQDMDDLQECLEYLNDQGIDVGLIAIDSIDHYIGSDEKKSERIKVVAEFEDMAARSWASVLVTSHTSMKAGSRGGTVVYQELMNTAPSVLMVAKDLENDDRRLVLTIKRR